MNILWEYIEIIIIMLFKFIMLFSAFMVLFSKNPVHSVLYLVLLFCVGAGILLSLDMEFLGIIYVVVYVGAIAVLFLFVVMMLNVRVLAIKSNYLFLPVALLLGFVLMIELWLSFFKQNNFIGLGKTWSLNNLYEYNYYSITNLEVLGQLLYTYQIHFFIFCGQILLIAMIGAIILTLQERKNVRSQKIWQQQDRKVSLFFYHDIKK
jgi:NADH-quinone oxidoreductase subunit J